MKVRWSAKAVSHLQALHSYIAKDSLPYAARTVEQILNREAQISRFPESGKRVRAFPGRDLREVIEGHYRIVYEVKSDLCIVVAVIHTARTLKRKDVG